MLFFVERDFSKQIVYVLGGLCMKSNVSIIIFVEADIGSKLVQYAAIGAVFVPA